MTTTPTTLNSSPSERVASYSIRANPALSTRLGLSLGGNAGEDENGTGQLERKLDQLTSLVEMLATRQ
eukprot:CAMPEP_0202470506 /NCGR_PEP_ID=MMETSP1360-20130828/81800_1 /ASSEMBLY_ACC=CAM_ASM_000848 /TAXON_ID=515479 /ORGANISM="Licmophora paradoxa, Strain CCMP2313" /LENGTH=67 /DNA_ID=CAMNT_0049096231 /DNA_START=193 /DNA_END=393 /DNA_ORIENTATION=-